MALYEQGRSHDMGTASDEYDFTFHDSICAALVPHCLCHHEMSLLLDSSIVDYVLLKRAVTP
jgi:hypothetical protein